MSRKCMTLNSLTASVLSLVGARVNAKDNKWLTPLHRAVASCSEVCECLCDYQKHNVSHHLKKKKSK